MNHNRSPSFRRSPIQKPPESDSIKHKDKSSRQSFINHGSSLKADQPSSSRKFFSEPSEFRKHSNTQLNAPTLQNGHATPSIYQASMKYRNVGKSGLRVSSYGIAVWQNMSSKIGEEQVESIVQAAYEKGIFYFDTGDAFSNGKSEQLLGNILKKFNWPRNSYVVSTKLFWNHPVDQPPNKNKNIALNRKYLIEAVKASLKRLKLDYIDFVLINRLDGQCPTEEIVRTMNMLINNGLILYWGTSRFHHVHVNEMFAVCRQFNCIPPIVEQMEYSPTVNREKCEVHLNEIYHRLGIGVISWSGNLLGADPGIALISRKSLMEYQNMVTADESHAVMQAQAVDRVDEQIVIVPGKPDAKAEGKADGKAEGKTEGKAEGESEGKLSSLMKLGRKLSTPDKKKVEKNLSVKSDQTADRLSIQLDHQSIDKRSSISATEQSNRLAELDAIINKLNVNRAQFDAVWNLRNEPVCTTLIQPLSVEELQLYLDALKLEIPVSLLLEVDKICSTKFGCAKYPASELGDVEDEPTSQNV